MMKLSVRDILSIPHLRASGFGSGPSLLNGISIDSRTLQRGNLFFAIKGAMFDGHNFLSKAVESGAPAVIVEERWTRVNEGFLLSLPVPYLVVEDTVVSLGRLASAYRQKFRIPVLAVGGSNGKTTTKEMIRAVLETKYTVLATEGNLNNHLGVPLMLLRLEKRHDVAVLEIGTNHPGEIRYLCELLQPTHGLITNIGQEHLEHFGTIAGVARAEGELFDWLAKVRKKSATLFINADDGHLAKRMKHPGKVLSFGFKRGTVRGSRLKLMQDGSAHFQVKAKGKPAFDLQLGVPGLQNAQNALAAATVGLSFRIPGKMIRTALGSFQAPGKRMEVLTIDGVTILNDTYNSNPDSVKAALQTLKAIKSSGKKIAVLADMLELGSSSETFHRKVAKQVEASRAECLLGFGPLTRATVESANVKFKAHYEHKNMLSEYLIELLAPGDVVLIKGSRGMKMEDVVTFLKERLSKAA